MIGIENLGGSIIKSSRCAEFVTDKGFKKAVKNIKNAKVDCVVVVGGNGSYNGAKSLKDAGVNVIAVPGTIDNDLYYTSKSLGYDTACANAIDAIEKTYQSLQAFSRGAVVEVMGRHCPDIAVTCAILSNAHMLITENLPFEKILQDVNGIIKSGVESPLIIVQENILNVDDLAKFLQQNTQKEFRSSVLGYIQRGGKPTNAEKLLAIELAVETINDIVTKRYGVAVGKDKDEIFSIDIDKALKCAKRQNDHFLSVYNSIKHQ